MVEQVPQNGSPPPQAPEPPVPQCRIVYQQLPNGARVVIAVEIAGAVFGGVIALQTGYDSTLPSKEHPRFAPLTLKVHWPYEWVDVAKLQPELVVATKMPPEPPHPRIVR